MRIHHPNKSISSRNFFFNWDFIIIGLVGLATHGFILIMDGTYYDDWLLNTFISENNRHELTSWFSNAGMPLFGQFNWWMGCFPDVVLAYRGLILLTVIVCACLIYNIGRHTGVLGRSDSMLIALLGLTYPAVQNLFQELMLEYLACYLLFLLGALCAIRSEQTKGVSRWVRHGGALVLFFVAFNTNSLLTFYFGFLGMLAIWVRHDRGLSVRELCFNWFPRRSSYLLLPFMFWIMKQIASPRRGLYADYNRLRLSPTLWAYSTAKFLVNAVWYPLNDALYRMIREPLLVVFIVWIVVLACSLIRVNSRRLENGPNASRMILFGILLFACGVIPYIAIGSYPARSGWSTRFALLVGLPLALVIIGVTRQVFSRHEMGLTRLGVTFLVGLIFAFGLSNIINYISWQARWVKDRAVMVNLAGMEGARSFSVYWIDDQYPLGGEDNYRFYEWSSIFKQVWGSEARVGLDRRYVAADFLRTSEVVFTKAYNLSEFDPSGCEASVTIRRGLPTVSEIGLVGRYYYYKFLAPARLDGFLALVAEVQVQKIEAPFAVNCRSH